MLDVCETDVPNPNELEHYQNFVKSRRTNTTNNVSKTRKNNSKK